MFSNDPEVYDTLSEAEAQVSQTSYITEHFQLTPEQLGALMACKYVVFYFNLNECAVILGRDNYPLIMAK